ncbi:CaiB/BaiF CoA transferase family protein [Futiania mangrovi]|uniref:CoA transferase n=1 Tax=Futiania mangrovi TaxID=2959716 RepID=A0A9J6P8Y2_9PROT|nr:CoA transferase [Futiania mangrovii]MCP1336260.1 CoA transferase [Futiania mangrovii]
MPNDAATASGDFKPFRGVKVLDFSLGMAGPNCGMQFAQFGADVIKIEPPQGDWSRTLGVNMGGHTPLSATVNRGKRSIALDLKNPQAQKLVQRMAEDADVVIESFRPGVADRLGFGYETLGAINPGLVYVSVSGFGQTGPYAKVASTDTVAQAYPGMMWHTRDMEGRPMKIGFFVIDAAASLYAFQAAAAALYARRGGAPGRHLDISLMAAAAALQAPKVTEYSVEKGATLPVNVPAGNYETADGWVAITLMREEQFHKICKVLGVPDLPADPRFDSFRNRGLNSRPLRAILDPIVKSRTTAEWVEALKEADVLCAPINTIGDWLEDEHVRATGAATHYAHPGLGEVAMPVLPGLVPGDSACTAVAPGVGEHAAEILAEHGYDAAGAETLRAAGAFG